MTINAKGINILGKVILGNNSSVTPTVVDYLDETFDYTLGPIDNNKLPSITYPSAAAWQVPGWDFITEGVDGPSISSYGLLITNADNGSVQLGLPDTPDNTSYPWPETNNIEFQFRITEGSIGSIDISSTYLDADLAKPYDSISIQLSRKVSLTFDPSPEDEYFDSVRLYISSQNPDVPETEIDVMEEFLPNFIFTGSSQTLRLSIDSGGMARIYIDNILRLSVQISRPYFIFTAGDETGDSPGFTPRIDVYGSKFNSPNVNTSDTTIEVAEIKIQQIS